MPALPSHRFCAQHGSRLRISDAPRVPSRGKAEGCEGRVPSDRCQHWLQVVTFLSDRWEQSREGFQPAAKFINTFEGGGRLCVLWMVNSTAISIFLHVDLLCLRVLLFYMHFKTHFKIVSEESGAEEATEVDLNAGVLQKKARWEEMRNIQYHTIRVSSCPRHEGSKITVADGRILGSLEWNNPGEEVGVSGVGQRQGQQKNSVQSGVKHSKLRLLFHFYIHIGILMRFCFWWIQRGFEIPPPGTNLP